MPLLLLRCCSAAAAVHELLYLVPERVQYHKSTRRRCAARLTSPSRCPRPNQLQSSGQLHQPLGAGTSGRPGR